MPDRWHLDAFGRPIVDPATLPPRQALDLFRAFIGRTLASPRIDDHHVAQALARWLRGEGKLDKLLGIRAPRGSRLRPERVIRDEETRRLLLRLADRAGGATRASRLLRGQEPAPADLSDLVSELRARHAPTSRRTLCRKRSETR